MAPEPEKTDKEALDELASAVADLRQSVEGMQQDKVDEETVQKIATVVTEKLQAANPAFQRKHGYLPEDGEGDPTPNARLGQGKQLLQALHSRPAAQVAQLAKRDVEDVRHFQQTADRLVLLASVLRRDPEELDFFETEYKPAVQALDTQTAAEGLEFVPTALSGSLIERVNLELRIAALFDEIVMPTQPYEIVGRGVARIRGGRGVENTADTGQTLAKKITAATRKITLRAGKFEGEMLVSKEAEEDSIVPMLAFMEEELVDFLMADIEDSILNGDQAGAQDSDTNAANDPRLNYNGLRKLAIAGAKTDLANALLTVAMLRTNRAKMGKYGVDPRKVVNVVSINSYMQLLADTNVLTMDKYGPNATIVTGELGKADGVPIVVSEYVRTDLNATGVFDNVTTNRTVALTVNRRGYLRGVRRELEVQILRELYAEADQDAIIVRQRRAFQPRFPSATEKTVAVSYNGSTA
jgi:HK97 family phage major capsid protein